MSTLIKSVAATELNTIQANQLNKGGLNHFGYHMFVFDGMLYCEAAPTDGVVCDEEAAIKFLDNTPFEIA